MQQTLQTSSRVLIVDDDSAFLKLLHVLLSEEPAAIVAAEDGRTALDLARDEPPDLVLLDVMMPDIDGLTVCRRLRESPATEDVPIIMMTASRDKRARLDAFEAGAVDYINKPIEEAELLARVRTHLSLRHAMRSLREHNARLKEQIAERLVAEAELSRTKEQLEHELVERARAEAERADLQARIISAQNEQLRELSTPLIPIQDEIVVMPLIGSVDRARAQRAMEVALAGVSGRGAGFVIIDITGVPSIDAEGATGLMQMTAGLRLLGAQAIITGVSPGVAQVLVDEGLSLGPVATAATLQGGIALAMRAART